MGNAFGSRAAALTWMTIVEGGVEDPSRCRHCEDRRRDRAAGRRDARSSTPAKVKAAMLNARSLRWADTGAALFTMNKILDTLEIRDAVKAKHDMSAPAPSLGPGEMQINIYPLSEIMPNKALRNMGPVIPELQVPAVVTATISTNTPNAAAARGEVPAGPRSSRLSKEMVSNGEQCRRTVDLKGVFMLTRKTLSALLVLVTSGWIYAAYGIGATSAAGKLTTQDYIDIEQNYAKCITRSMPVTLMAGPIRSPTTATSTGRSGVRR